MVGAAGFGILMVVVGLSLTTILPSEAGWALWWAIVSVQLAVAAVVTWRRTHLLLTSVAMGLGSSVALGLVGLAGLDLSWPELLIAHWGILIPAMLVGPLLLWIESRRHPDQWRDWRRHMDSCSARDVLVLRHIPDWRAR